MARWSLSLVALLAITSGAQASLHQFICSEQISPNEITVLGSGIFELADSPVNTHQYPAITPLQIQVEAMDGPVQFDLLRASTLEDKIHLIFEEPGGVRLYMGFDVAGIATGAPVPPSWGDDDGVVQWNTNNMMLDPQGNYLFGKKMASVAAVPEPSAFALGAIALGLVGGGRVMRKRCSPKETTV